MYELWEGGYPDGQCVETVGDARDAFMAAAWSVGLSAAPKTVAVVRVRLSGERDVVRTFATDGWVEHKGGA